jgi:hypothetical protein
MRLSQRSLLAGAALLSYNGGYRAQDLEGAPDKKAGDRFF